MKFFQIFILLSTFRLSNPSFATLKKCLCVCILAGVYLYVILETDESLGVWTGWRGQASQVEAPVCTAAGSTRHRRSLSCCSFTCARLFCQDLSYVIFSTLAHPS